MAKPRETRIPADVQALYDSEGNQIVVPVNDPEAIEEAIIGALGILRYGGGAVTFGPIRHEVKEGSGVFVTTEYVMRWHPFVPAVSPNGSSPVELSEEEAAEVPSAA
jgi:hypothetical protein